MFSSLSLSLWIDPLFPLSHLPPSFFLSHSSKLTLFLSFFWHIFSPFPLFSLTSHFFLSRNFSPSVSLSLFPSLSLSSTLTFSIFPFSQPHSSSLSFSLSLSQIIHPSRTSFYPSATIRSQSSTRHTLCDSYTEQTNKQTNTHTHTHTHTHKHSAKGKERKKNGGKKLRPAMMMNGNTTQ